MELTTRSLRPAALTAAFGLFATLAISTGSASAIEAGSLTVTGPTTGVVGSPTVLTATGHVPSDASLARYVYVYAIPASVASTCPTSRTGALQLSDATDAMGGESVAFIAVEETSRSLSPTCPRPRDPSSSAGTSARWCTTTRRPSTT